MNLWAFKSTGSLYFTNGWADCLDTYNNYLVRIAVLVSYHKLPVYKTSNTQQKKILFGLFLGISIILNVNKNKTTSENRVMDSDFGVPRELSHLQKLRSQYQPELPPCLQVFFNYFLYLSSTMLKNYQFFLGVF